MYNDVKVLDIHGHVSAPMHGTPTLALMLASNTPLSVDPREAIVPRLGLSEEAWDESVTQHVTLLDEYNIDAQLIGPRPFLMLGWMNQHLLPQWTRFVNNSISKQVSMAPTRFVGAAQLPQNADADDLSQCIPELERCVNELEFKAVYLLSLIHI